MIANASLLGRSGIRSTSFPGVIGRSRIADAGRVEHGVGDGRGRADDADLADALRAHGLTSGRPRPSQCASISRTSALTGTWYAARSVDVVAELRVQHALLEQRHADSPMVIPPMNCERAVLGLRMRPAANTPVSLGTRTSPVSASTRTSANWAPKAWRASGGRRSSSACRRSTSPGGLAAVAASPQRRAGLVTAQPQDAVPIDPPATVAGGASCRRSRPRTRSGGTSERVRGDLRQHRARAGADVGGGDAHGERCRRPRPGRSPSTACGGPGRSTRDAQCRSASRPSRRAAGRGSRRGQPNRSAPSRRHSTRCREENGLPLSGSISGSLRIRSSIGSMSRRWRARRPRTPGRTSRGTRRAPASRRRRDVERDHPVGRAAAATRTSSGYDGRLLRELLRPATSARRRRARSPTSRPSASAPSRSAGSSASGSRSSANICRRVTASFTGRPYHGAAITASTACGRGVPFDAEPAADVCGTTRTCPHPGRTPRPASGPHRTRPGWSRTGSAGHRPSRARVRAAPSGCCAPPASCTWSTATAARPARPRRRLGGVGGEAGVDLLGCVQAGWSARSTTSCSARRSDAHQPAACSGRLQLVRDHGGDDLAAVGDVGATAGRRARRRGPAAAGRCRGGARRAPRPARGLPGVDRVDPAAGDRRLHDDRVGNVRPGCARRRSGPRRVTFSRALDAVDRRSRWSARWSASLPRPARVSVRTSVAAPAASCRRCRGAAAPGRAPASAARSNVAASAGAPRSSSSAACARHGLCATPPSAIRTSSTPPSRDVQRGRHRDHGEREGRAVAHLAVRRVGAGSLRRQLHRDDQLVRARAPCPACGSSPGSRWSSAMRDRRARRRAAARGPRRRARSSATAMSDGWVATQAGECPSTARLRWSPSTRRAAGARLALVARLGDVLEVGAAGPLQQVAAGGRHVAQLARRARQQRLGEHRVARRAPCGSAARSLLRHRAPIAQPAVGQLIDPVERQAGDVDRAASGRLDAQPHQVDQVGAAAEAAAPRSCRRAARHGAALVVGPLVPERLHRARPPAIAAHDVRVGAAAADVAAHPLADLGRVELRIAGDVRGDA